VDELEHQLRSSSSQVLITCTQLLGTALKAAKAVGIPDEKIFLIDVAGVTSSAPVQFKRIDALISDGSSLPELEPLRWTKGQGARQTAFLCYSSGTSGLPVSMLQKARVIY
jgi:acyl-CoA synthetase (AMP-forming)/AMP-acid ligase II